MRFIGYVAVVVWSWFSSGVLLMMLAGIVHAEVLPAVTAFSLNTALKLSLLLVTGAFVSGVCHQLIRDFLGD